MSIFAGLEDALSQACDNVFGDSFELRPMQAEPGGGRRTVDGSRQVKTVIGIHQVRLFKSTEFGTEARGSLPATMSRPTVSIDRRQFVVGQSPRRFDLIKNLASGELFEIAQDPGTDAEGRVQLWLKSLGFEIE